MLTSKLTRRSVLKAVALAPPAFAASSLAAPVRRGAYAAGKLSMGTWDHWVPGASQSATEDLRRNGRKRKRSSSRSI